MKTSDELINKSEPGLDTVQQWLAEAKTRMKFCRETKIIPHGSFWLTGHDAFADRCNLLRLRRNFDRSRGRLRILGSGCKRLNRGIYDFTLGKSFAEARRMPSYLLVADDVLGGFFAINGGAFAGEAGNVFYYAPGSGEWEGRREDVASLSPDKTMFALPPLL